MAHDFHWGPTNPHPLSTMRTELVWEGKYDEYGHRREVDVAAAALPMQRIETVDEPRQRAAAEGQLALFEKNLGQQKRDDFRNRLIWGDNKLVMASLLKEFKGQIDLIYIDPPFDVGADFTMDVPLGDGKETVEKDQSTLEMVAYRDMWGKGTDSYLYMMYERLSLMKELLSDAGSIYVHCDTRVNSFLRAILDELFGEDSFVNEIVWQRLSAHNDADKYGPIHDTIFFYAKHESHVWNPQFEAVSPEYLAQFFDQVDEATGRRYARGDLTARGTRRGETGKPWRGIDPTKLGNHWKVRPTDLEALDAAGKIHWPKKEGGMPRLKRFEDEVQGRPLQDLWTDIKLMHNISSERTGYATQKPEALLERIIRASTSEIGGGHPSLPTSSAAAERPARWPSAWDAAGSWPTSAASRFIPAASA